MPKPFFRNILAVAVAMLSLGAAGLCLAQTAPAAPRMAADPAQASYTLGQGDKLRMIIYGEENLTGEYVVSSEGRLALPLIGEVQAAGLSVAQVQNLIEEKYKNGYLREPSVSLEVLTYRPFYILGEVNKPGEYPYTSGLTVMKAVATAQGFTYRANSKKVFIKHQGETGEKPYKMDDSTPLAPGDVVRVAERFF
jgi:protein involved in polysaccharide export with SLBB domain